MSQKIIEFDEKKQGIKFDLRNGYKVILPDMVVMANKYFRRDANGIYLIQKISYGKRPREVARGYLVEQGTDLIEEASFRKDIASKQEHLAELLEDSKAIALSCCKEAYNYYCFREGHNAIMYCKCDKDDEENAVMGAAWHGEPSESRKGLLMCSFLLYATGIINAGFDETLFEATYRYLLYESGLGDPEDFDGIIFDAMRKQFSPK